MIEEVVAVFLDQVGPAVFAGHRAFLLVRSLRALVGQKSR